MTDLRNMAFKATLLSACIFGRAQGHMILANPVPYSHATIDNSPLTSSNYPCKLTGDASTFYATTGIDNTYAAGSTQTLSFKGSATHGGGSCQLALSSDMQPSASTDWRVILSLEGGCPTTDLTGATGASTYNWTVPASLTPGSYSFAWTWISKEAGQAEYYMNCAPITVTAGTSTTKRDTAGVRREDTSYPELFVANLADINDCKTTEGSDYVYPFGGAVENLGVPAASLKYTTITSASCVPKGQAEGGNYLPTAGVTGGGGSGGGAASATNVAAAPTAAGSSASSNASALTTPAAATSSDGTATTLVTSTAAPQSSPSETVYVSPVVPRPSTQGTGQAGSATTTATATQVSPSGGVTSAAPSSAQASSASSSSAASSSNSSTLASSSATTLAASSAASSPSSTTPASSAASSAAQPTATGGSGGSSSSSSAGTMRGPCTDEGEFNCVGSDYQQCASGAWTAMQALPGGTACTQGLSMGLWAGESSRRARGLGPDGVRRIRRGRRGD